MTESSANQPWVPTHRVPREGMDAWASPDPAVEPSTDLAAGIEVRVLDTAGEWAQVQGVNGWTGWVDGKLLEQLAPAGVPSGDGRAYLLLGIAVAVLAVLAVLAVVG